MGHYRPGLGLNLSSGPTFDSNEPQSLLLYNNRLVCIMFAKLVFQHYGSQVMVFKRETQRSEEHRERGWSLYEFKHPTRRNVLRLRRYQRSLHQLEGILTIVSKSPVRMTTNIIWCGFRSGELGLRPKPPCNSKKKKRLAKKHNTMRFRIWRWERLHEECEDSLKSLFLIHKIECLKTKRWVHIFQVDYIIKKKSLVTYSTKKRKKHRRSKKENERKRKDKRNVNLRFCCCCDLLFPTSLNTNREVIPNSEKESTLFMSVTTKTRIWGCIKIKTGMFLVSSLLVLTRVWASPWDSSKAIIFSSKRLFFLHLLACLQTSHSLTTRMCHP